MLQTARAAHPPWALYRAAVTELDDELVVAAGLPAPSGDPIVHWSPGVDVSIGRPERLGRAVTNPTRRPLERTDDLGRDPTAVEPPGLWSDWLVVDETVEHRQVRRRWSRSAANLGVGAGYDHADAAAVRPPAVTVRAPASPFHSQKLRPFAGHEELEVGVVGR